MAIGRIRSTDARHISRYSWATGYSPLSLTCWLANPNRDVSLALPASFPIGRANRDSDVTWRAWTGRDGSRYDAHLRPVSVVISPVNFLVEPFTPPRHFLLSSWRFTSDSSPGSRYSYSSYCRLVLDFFVYQNSARRWQSCFSNALGETLHCNFHRGLQFGLSLPPFIPRECSRCYDRMLSISLLPFPSRVSRCMYNKSFRVSLQLWFNATENFADLSLISRTSSFLRLCWTRQRVARGGSTRADFLARRLAGLMGTVQ